MRKVISICIVLCWAVSVSAQTVFIGSGRIEYERKINVARQFESSNEDGDWWKDYLSKQPKFFNSYFTLDFNQTRSIYKYNRSEDKMLEAWVVGPAKENSVLTDFETRQYTSRRTIFEQTFIVADSANTLHWKLSNETRVIAGFECRKAVAVICDSVYVVAFYCEEIPVSGGPESFGGLPGMILGLAIPRLYSTWYATKVELMEPPASSFTINTKGKKTKAKELAPLLTATFKDWDKRGQKFIWWSML
jgi:GLPGLI family protein